MNFLFLYNKYMRRLKSSVVIILVLFSLIGFTCLGIYIKNKNNIKNDEIVIEPEVISTFKGTISNTINVPQEVVDLICNYMDSYYLSLYNLDLDDTSKYFSNTIKGELSNRAISLCIDNRKLYDYDLSLSSGYYDLKFTECYFKDNKYHVSFLEDDYMNFAFLNGITSKCLDIENYMEIEKVNDEYKICDYEKTQDYYIMFSENNPQSINEINELYNYYYKQLKNFIEDELLAKQKYEGISYSSDADIDIEYDRQKAVEYSYKYYHLKNSDWYDFSDEGGNCQNYASQCIYAGINKMDYYGDLQWKCYIEDPDYDPGISEDDERSGRSISWVHVSTFADYAKENQGEGLVCDVDSDIYYGQPGDIVQVGISSVRHTTIISDVVDGHILLNSNSVDMKDWPLNAYTYPVKKLIKVLGYND